MLRKNDTPGGSSSNDDRPTRYRSTKNPHNPHTMNPRRMMILLCLTIGWAEVNMANIWTQKANLTGAPRRSPFGFSISGKGYIGTGNDGPNTYNDLWEYNPGTDAWTQKANMPGSARWLAIGFAIGTKGYAGLGEDQFSFALNDFYQYDPVTNIWTLRANFAPGIRRGATAFTIGAKGYVACGQNGVYVGTLQSDLWEYDPAANSWTQRANFTGGPRFNPLSFGLGGYGYLGTGYNGTTSVSDMWRFDPSVNTWTQVASFPGVGRTQAIGMAIGSTAYVGAGYGNASNYLSDFWEYDPNDFFTPWKQRDNVGGPPRSLSATFVIGNKGYVASGIAQAFYGGLWEFNALDINCGLSSVLGICSGASTSGFFATYSVYNGSFDPGNVFTVHLSDASGSFASPTFLGSMVSNASSGSIPVVFPAGLATGSGYRIRVSSSAPFEIGNPSGPTTVIYVVSPGDPCDDGDPCTIGDQLGPNCFCMGGASSADSDGDGFCDAIDGCPFNGLLQAPIGWFPDSDGDGFGDAGALGILDCNPPVQNWVNNQSDLCPFDPAKQSPGTCGCGNLEPGASCDDGNPCTAIDIIAFNCACIGSLPLDSDGDGFLDCVDNCPNLYGQMGDPCNDNNFCSVNDVINGSCVCMGSTPDPDNDGYPDCIDSCPLLYGLMGDPCNDNNPNTSNDVINGSCVCVGTCINAVTLTLNTDASASQTSWDIVVGNTNSIVCSGNGYPNNSTIPVTCCLANGCYDLRVYDSFGDGINPGGYVLRDAATNRLIDNSSNGPNFGSLSEVLDVSNNPVSFCVPMGTDALVPTSCDQTGLTTNSVIQAQINANVTAQYGFTNATSGYQFWVFAPNTGYSRRLFQSHAAPGTGWPLLTPVAQRAAYLKLSAMTSVPTIPSNVQLNVRVRSRVANVYGEFGPACRLTIGTVTNCSTTQLTTTTTPVVSCGAVLLNRLTGVIWSNNVLLANKYQFEFVNANTLVFLRNISSPTRNLNMSTWGNAIALPTCFIPYNIRVRVSFNNGATWCPWGAVCQVNFTCPPENGRAMETAIADHGTLSIWPNPNNGEQFTLALSGLDANDDHIDLVIFDAFGKEVMTHVYPASDGEVNTTIDFKRALTEGVYVVRIDDGKKRMTQRLIVQ